MAKTWAAIFSGLGMGAEGLYNHRQRQAEIARQEQAAEFARKMSERGMVNDERQLGFEEQRLGMTRDYQEGQLEHMRALEALQNAELQMGAKTGIENRAFQAEQGRRGRLSQFGILPTEDFGSGQMPNLPVQGTQTVRTDAGIYKPDAPDPDQGWRALNMQRQSGEDVLQYAAQLESQLASIVKAAEDNARAVYINTFSGRDISKLIERGMSEDMARQADMTNFIEGEKEKARTSWIAQNPGYVSTREAAQRIVAGRAQAGVGSAGATLSPGAGAPVVSPQDLNAAMRFVRPRGGQPQQSPTLTPPPRPPQDTTPLLPGWFR